MPDEISLFDDKGRLISMATLGKKLAELHGGVAPLGLLKDLRVRHAEAVKLGLGKNSEEASEKMNELVGNLFKEK